MAIPPYEKSHKIALIGTITSIVVLIITLYCVWYPYLQTSQFISALCVPYAFTDNGPTTCQSVASETECTTLPPNSPVTGYFNISTWSTVVFTLTTTTGTPSLPASTTSPSTRTITPTINTDPSASSHSTSQSTTTTTPADLHSISATFSPTFTEPSPTVSIPNLASNLSPDISVQTTTTPADLRSISATFSPTVSPTITEPSPTIKVKRKRKRDVTITGTIPGWLSSVTPPSEPYCASFPCIAVLVIFRTTYGVTIQSIGALYTDYSQMQTYPKCTYSACSSNNTANYNTVRSMLNATNTQFPCYVNLYQTPRPVLQQVNFSYSAAANSILWPILSLIIFGTCLIVFRCFAWSAQSKARTPGSGMSSPPIDNDIPYAVNYTGDLQPPHEMPFPPAYADAASANGVSLQFAGTNEKNPAVDLGDGSAIGAGGPSYSAQWVFMYPPEYDEAAMTVDEKRPTGDSQQDATSGVRTASGWTSDGNSMRY